MPSIETYDDYRDYLKDCYDERRKLASYFSYRYIGNRVGMDSSYVTRLFQKKAHIVDDQIPRFAKLLGLDDREREYFECLVAFNKARNDTEAKAIHDRLVKLRGVGYVELSADRRAFFGSWHAVALRNLLDMRPQETDPSVLAAALRPSITPEEVVSALELLQRLGLAIRGPEGWRIPDVHLHSGEDHGDPAIRGFQAATLQLAARSLREDPPSVREIGTMTMNINAEQVSDLKILVKEFQENVARLIDDGSASDRIYQLNLQLFPLSALPEVEP